jgi:hypothetical protein
MHPHGPHWGHRKGLGSDDFANFRNNGMAAGLDGNVSVGHTGPVLPTDVVGIDGADLFWRGAITQIVPPGFIDDYYRVGVGNPPSEECDGYAITSSDVYALLAAYRIYAYAVPVKHVVEIGGGFGALAAMIAARDECEQYTCVDLPDSLKLQQYYLEKMGVGEKMTYVEAGSTTWRTWTASLTHPELIINCRSMMEMEPATVDKYFEWINGSAGWFYCVNSYRKYTQMALYPFDDWWQIHVSQPQIGQPWIHEYLLSHDGRGGFKHQLHTLPRNGNDP